MKLSAVLRSLIYHPDCARSYKRSPSKVVAEDAYKDSSEFFSFKPRLNENTNSERGVAESIYDRRMARIRNKYFANNSKDKCKYNSTQIILEESKDSVSYEREAKRVVNVPQQVFNSINRSKGQLPVFLTNVGVSKGFNKSSNYDQENAQGKEIMSYRNDACNFPAVQNALRSSASSRGQFKRKFSMIKHTIIEPVDCNKVNKDVMYTERMNRVGVSKSSLKSLSTIRKRKYIHSEWNKENTKSIYVNRERLFKDKLSLKMDSHRAVMKSRQDIGNDLEQEKKIAKNLFNQHNRKYKVNKTEIITKTTNELYTQFNVGKKEPIILVPRLCYTSKWLTNVKFAIDEGNMFISFEPELENSVVSLESSYSSFKCNS